MDSRAHFHHSLERLQIELIKMGDSVEHLISKAVTSLATMDVQLAKEIVEKDDKIDDMMLQIEDKCLRMIALQQPMARDLRIIGMAVKIATDLERIADHAVDIAKTTLRLSGETLIKPLVDIPRMAEKTKNMLHEALQAYVDRNVAKAEALAAMDDEIDKMYGSLFEEIINLMGNDLYTNRQVTHLLMVAHYLERIGDHATNIGEWVIYMVNGTRTDLNI